MTAGIWCLAEVRSSATWGAAACHIFFLRPQRHQKGGGGSVPCRRRADVWYQPHRRSISNHLQPRSHPCWLWAAGTVRDQAPFAFTLCFRPVLNPNNIYRSKSYISQAITWLERDIIGERTRIHCCFCGAELPFPVFITTLHYFVLVCLLILFSHFSCSCSSFAICLLAHVWHLICQTKLIWFLQNLWKWCILPFSKWHLTGLRGVWQMMSLLHWCSFFSWLFAFTDTISTDNSSKFYFPHSIFFCYYRLSSWGTTCGMSLYAI